MKVSMFVCAALLVLPTLSAAADDPFNAHWHDGKAELDGYHLVVSRYGQDRTARCVMIFVTEPFSESKRVKVDDPKANPKDTFDALKLNLVRDFQTGIYDYSTMVSVFVRSATMEPVKVAFSSMEWCGIVYSQMIFHPGHIRGNCSSYFENESGPIDLGRPGNGVTEDELFIALRGLHADYMSPGQTRTVPFLPGTFYTRLSHKPLEWTQATITRSADTQTITVPAGSFECMVYDVHIGDGRAGHFLIESAYPHRIVKWSLPPDVDGELSGSARLEYWNLHGEGGEKYLDQLGLKPCR